MTKYSINVQGINKKVENNINICMFYQYREVDIIGITVTVDVFDGAIEITKVYQSKGIPVVAGGIHITAFPEEAKKYFDVLSVGLAEKTWPDIMRDFQDGKLKKTYCCNHEIKGSDIISPGYHLIDTKKYLYCNIISTSRGCPFWCDFCYNSCEAYKTLYINRPIKDVITDIKTIGKLYALIGHVRFDKGEAMKIVSLLYFKDLNSIIYATDIFQLYKQRED